MRFFWVCTFLASIVAGLALFYVLATSKGAPQEAAGAAIAIALAAIPYVFTRALEGLDNFQWRRDMLKAIRELAAVRQPSPPASVAAPSEPPLPAVAPTRANWDKVDATERELDQHRR